MKLKPACKSVTINNQTHFRVREGTLTRLYNFQGQTVEEVQHTTKRKATEWMEKKTK